MTIPNGAAIVLGAQRLVPRDVWSVAYRSAHATLDPAPEFRARIEAGAQMLHQRLDAGERIYGVNTGFGESVLTEVPAALTDDLATNLVRFHGCGTGVMLTEPQSAAVVLVRAASLAAGWSGVRYDVLERLCRLLNARVLPVIPSEGA